MRPSDNSKSHHWFPVALQKYWQDADGNISYIKPNGTIIKKKVANRKVGTKRHGHTLLKGTEWEENFESEFDIDNKIHTLIEYIEKLHPLKGGFLAAIKLIWRALKNNKDPKSACRYHYIDKETQRIFILFLYSILIRSPQARYLCESYPSLFGLPRNEDVGKANMQQNFMEAKRQYETGSMSNQYFIIIFSPANDYFLYGDGCLDWLTYNTLGKRALIPLTPQICIYYCTPHSMRSNPNCASFIATPEIIEEINILTQIHSKEFLFFYKKPPILTDHFKISSHLKLADRRSKLIDMLDEIAGNTMKRGLLGLGSFN